MFSGLNPLRYFEKKKDEPSNEPFFGLIIDFDTIGKFKDKAQIVQIKEMFQIAIGQNAKIGIVVNGDSKLIDNRLKGFGLTQEEIEHIQIREKSGTDNAIDYIKMWSKEHQDRKMIALYLDDDAKCVKNLHKKFIELQSKDIEFLSLPTTSKTPLEPITKMKKTMAYKGDDFKTALQEVKEENEPLIKQVEAEHKITQIEAANRIKAAEQYRRRAQKVAAFRKVYDALYHGETTIWKSRRFTEGKENLGVQEMYDAIQNHRRKNPNSRSAFAWKLVREHYKDCTSPDLFEKVYKHATSKSGFFRNCCNPIDNQKVGDKRSANILRSLRGI